MEVARRTSQRRRPMVLRTHRAPEEKMMKRNRAKGQAKTTGTTQGPTVKTKSDNSKETFFVSKFEMKISKHMTTHYQTVRALLPRITLTLF